MGMLVLLAHHQHNITPARMSPNQCPPNVNATREKTLHFTSAISKAKLQTIFLQLHIECTHFMLGGCDGSSSNWATQQQLKRRRRINDEHFYSFSHLAKQYLLLTRCSSTHSFAWSIRAEHMYVVAHALFYYICTLKWTRTLALAFQQRCNDSSFRLGTENATKKYAVAKRRCGVLKKIHTHKKRATKWGKQLEALLCFLFCVPAWLNFSVCRCNFLDYCLGLSVVEGWCWIMYCRW